MKAGELVLAGLAAVVGIVWVRGASSSSSSPAGGGALPAPPGGTTPGFALYDAGGAGGMDWFRSLPQSISAREQAIYEAATGGFVRPFDWSVIQVSDGTHTLEVTVMSDVLCVGTADDWIRVSTSHRTAELIARSFGGYLCTSKIADLVAEWADVRVTPSICSAGTVTADQAVRYGVPQGASWLSQMSTNGCMLFAHDSVEGKRAGRSGLFSDAGKYWVNTPRLGTPQNPTRVATGIAAANYGFYPLQPDGSYEAKGPQGSKGSGGWSHGPGQWAVWQNVGLAHDIAHVDYSQTLRMVARTGTLDGELVDLADVAGDPALCALVSDEGPVLMLHPGIPEGTVMA